MYSFGWCRSIGDAQLLKEAGYDYIECAITDLKLENEKEYKRVLPHYLNSPLPIEAFNLFLPGDLKIVGPDVDQDRIDQYVAKVAEALSTIGAKIAVLGSGGARRIPEGWDIEKAEEQFVRVLERVADEFAGTDIVLAIEPLNRKATNLVNSVEEAGKFAKMINREPIKVLADFYHMELENESFQTLIDHRDLLAHIHVADTGRFSPGSGAYPYDKFVADLKKAGYQGRISVECTVRDNREFVDSLAFLKRKFC
ncbi:MAG TPA: sugar phosphate isomerase/epimerase family protein [Bacillales bacterium]